MQFWKNIVFSPPLYGADLLNTLMDDNSGAWNLNKLDSLLDQALTTKIKGVNTSYCYVGSWKALFCWHTQDLDLSAINFLHQGKSKFWYAIHHQDRALLEKEARKLFPQHYSACKEFLRHKTTLISPYQLKKAIPNLRIVKVEQHANEFILVFGGSYHSGFNFGFNIAEAVNYATLDWLRQMTDAKHCKCLKSSVKISQYDVYKNLLQFPHITATSEFKGFQEVLFKRVQEEDDSESRENAKVAINRTLSRKIKKGGKVPRKILYNQEQYQIDQWAQCDACNVWRIVSREIGKNQVFRCHKINKICHQRDKKPKDSARLITL